MTTRAQATRILDLGERLGAIRLRGPLRHLGQCLVLDPERVPEARRVMTLNTRHHVVLGGPPRLHVRRHDVTGATEQRARAHLVEADEDGKADHEQGGEADQEGAPPPGPLRWLFIHVVSSARASLAQEGEKGQAEQQEADPNGAEPEDPPEVPEPGGRGIGPARVEAPGPRETLVLRRARFLELVQTLSPGKDDEVNGKSIRRSEEHTSELQSRLHLVCRLLLEKK